MFLIACCVPIVCWFSGVVPVEGWGLALAGYGRFLGLGLGWGLGGGDGSIVSMYGKSYC